MMNLTKFLILGRSTEVDESLSDLDPYLAYHPKFAHSMPIQILLTSIVITLVTVLLIYLIFTGRYHWPLAPVNYSLQLAGVTTLLISLVATLRIVLGASLTQSMRWPYMLSYIAVNVPPGIDIDDEVLDTVWTVPQRVAWMLLAATAGCIIQITHIHFLTLLYPAKLHQKLIICLFGPLAIIVACMNMLAVSTDTNILWYSSATKNICNTALSVLFSTALFFWGFFVNRKEAWRMDDGTAIYGIGSLSLAVLGTTLNFLYLPRQEEYLWFPSLIWAVILWQSFLGWWWWVGAGGGLRFTDRNLREKATEARQNLRSFSSRFFSVERNLARRRSQQRRNSSPLD